MVAINFEPWTADLVARNLKPHTIRPRRKHAIKPGDMLQLYVGQRTKACRLLKEVECVRVTPIVIDALLRLVFLGGVDLPSGAVVRLVRNDGFSDLDDMLAWFVIRYGAWIFRGDLIAWGGPDYLAMVGA